MTIKHCPKCDEDKNTDCFLKDIKKKDGLSYYCKSCRSAYYKTYKVNNKDKISADCKEWWKLNKDIECEKRKVFYFKNKENINTANRKKYKEDPLRFKNYDLKKIYGISLKSYNELLEKQNNCCAICNKHKDNFTRALAVDHCHSSGKIRGLLCTNCNRAIGNLKDSIENTKNALVYLERQYEKTI